MVNAKGTLEKFLLVLFFLFLVVFPLGQLGRIEVGSEITLHLVDVFAGIMGFAWLILFFTKQTNLPKNLSFIFLTFFVVAAFSLILQFDRLSFKELLPSSLYLARLLAYILFFFALCHLISRKLIRSQYTLSYLLVVTGAVAISGLFQYFVFPDTRSLLEYGWDNHYYRAIGTFLDPAFTGILLVFFLNLVVSFPWGREKDKKALAILLFLLGFLALMLTYSRASYLAFLASSTILYIVRRNLWVFLASILLFITAVPNLPHPGGEGVNLTRTSTIVYRTNNYEQILDLVGKYPLFGVGYNTLRYHIDGGRHSGSGSDSSLLFVLVTCGVAGFLVFSFLLKEMVVLAWEGRENPTGLALLLSGTGLLAHSIFNNSLFYPWVLGFILILIAIQEVKESRQRL